jgi:hypothetical protein
LWPSFDDLCRIRDEILKTDAEWQDSWFFDVPAGREK